MSYTTRVLNLHYRTSLLLGIHLSVTPSQHLPHIILVRLILITDLFAGHIKGKISREIRCHDNNLSQCTIFLSSKSFSHTIKLDSG